MRMRRTLAAVTALATVPLLAGCPHDRYSNSNTTTLERLYDQYNCHSGAQRDTDTGAIVVKGTGKNAYFSHATFGQVRDNQYTVQNWCKR